MPTPAEPTIIAGRYRVVREVGRGGMGSVWLCVDDRLGREVAIKAVGRLPGQSVTDQARALREARTSAALNHPHVVAVYDALAEGEQVWLVMEYVPGHTLAELVARDGPLDPGRAARIGAQVADGLAAAHERGTVHRDVKPGNILVTDEDRAKITDFGIARTVGEETLTEHGMLTGTPTYMAPELARGQDPSPASDVWALGAALYAAVEGRPPYPDQPNALALLATIAEHPPLPPERAGELTGPIARMMDPDPVSRWTMADAAHALRRLAAARPASATRADLPVVAPISEAVAAPAVLAESPGDTRHRRRWGGLLAGVLAGLLVLAAVVAGALFLLTDDPAEDPVTSPSESTRESRTPQPDPTKTVTRTATATATPSSSPPAPTTSAPAAPANASAAAFVEGYYAVLPEDIDAGWAMLTEGYQQVTGYDGYRSFWSSIDDVTVVDTQPAGPGAMDADLLYTRGGETQSETRRIYLERSGEGYLISGSEPV